MKTRCYFIIAGAAVAGFAVWYQDYNRSYLHRRDALAAEQALQRAAEIEQKRMAHECALDVARQELEKRNAERMERAKREVLAQEQRDGWQSQLVAVREENAALRVSRERLVREIAEVEERLARQKWEQATIASEDRFLHDYITAAQASLARLDVIARRAETLRIAAVATPDPAQPTR
jgi:hypothetical protein